MLMSFHKHCICFVSSLMTCTVCISDGVLAFLDCVNSYLGRRLNLGIGQCRNALASKVTVYI